MKIHETHTKTYSTKLAKKWKTQMKKKKKKILIPEY